MTCLMMILFTERAMEELDQLIPAVSAMDPGRILGGGNTLNDDTKAPPSRPRSSLNSSPLRVISGVVSNRL